MLLLIQPILGFLHTSAHGDRVNLFFLGQLPSLIGQNRPFARQLLEIHEMVGLFLLGLTALHASAALYHHFWRCDDTLAAMLPQGMRRRYALPELRWTSLGPVHKKACLIAET